MKKNYNKIHLHGCGVVVITTAQLHSIKPEPSFFVGSNTACGVLETRDGEISNNGLNWK